MTQGCVISAMQKEAVLRNPGEKLLPNLVIELDPEREEDDAVLGAVDEGGEVPPQRLGRPVDQVHPADVHERLRH